MFGMDDLAAGGMGLIGGLVNNLFAGSRQSDQQAFAASQVAQQEAFQERMRSTAYQTATEDMKKAGLNPMMMYGSGAAAATPSGGAATTSAAPVSDIFGPALSSALAHAKAKNEIATGAMQQLNLSTQSGKNVADTTVADAEAVKKLAEIPGVEAASKITGNRVAASINERLQAEKEKPYWDSAISSILAPTAKGAQDVYKLIPPVKLNVNSGKSSQRGWIGANEVSTDTANFNQRFEFGR